MADVFIITGHAAGLAGTVSGWKGDAGLENDRPSRPAGIYGRSSLQCKSEGRVEVGAPFAFTLE